MRSFVFVLIFCALAQAAAADVIRLKSGRVVEGKIITETPYFIRVETNEAIIRQEFLLSDIESIQRGVSLKDLPQPAPVPVTEKKEAVPEKPPVPAVVPPSSVPEEPVAQPPASQTSEAPIPKKTVTPAPAPVPKAAPHKAPRPRPVPKSYDHLYVKPPPPLNEGSQGMNWLLFGCVFFLILYLGFLKRVPALPVPEGTSPAPLAMMRLIHMAVDRTKLVLFQSFTIKKWLLLLFIAWLAGALFSGGGNFNFNGLDKLQKAEAAPSKITFQSQGYSSSEKGTEVERFEHLEEKVSGELFPHGPTRGALTVALVIMAIFFILVVLFAWLSARFRFIWYNAIVRDDASVKAPFRQYKKQGDSLFKFYLGVGGLFIVIGILFSLWIVSLSAGPLFLKEPLSRWPGTLWLNTVVPPLLSAIFLLLFFVVLSVFVHEFVVPIMVIDDLTFCPAWRKFLQIYAARRGNFWKYIFVALLAGLACAVMAFLLMLAVILTSLLVGAIAFGLLYFLFVFVLKARSLFAVLAVILGIPAGIIVILMISSIGLPFAAFYRCFSLYFLANLHVGYAPLALDAPEVPGLTDKGEPSPDV